MKIRAFLLLFLGWQHIAWAQKINTAKLDSFFNALGTHDQSLGSVTISANGNVVYQKAFGYSYIGENTKSPATIKTKYRIGSISKMFTGTMIFQLVEEGKLSLDTHLATWFPQIPNAGKITISQMLSHRSGLHNFTNDALYQTYMSAAKSETELVALFAQQKPDFEPNEKAQYSNTNFVLLGYVIEKLTGKSYAQELTRRITSKIGLKDTYYGGKINTAKDEAYSYNFAGRWIPATETDMSIPGGAGAVVSTPTDLVRFIDALFTGRLISTDHLEMMKKIKDNYGMAMFTYPFYDKMGFGHTGGIDGFSSMLIYFPQDKVSIAYTANGMRYTLNDAIIGALSIYYNMPFVIPGFKAIHFAPGDLSKYAGRYGSIQIPLKIDITEKDHVLYAQGTGQVKAPLEAEGDAKFANHAFGATFIFDTATKSFTLLQNGARLTFTKEDK